MMNNQISIYRKRFIPDETNYLKDDIIVYMDDDIIVTKWKTLKPRKDISRGMSIYYMNRGYKVSKMYSSEDEIVYWYCDIVNTVKNENKNEIVFEDLLLDVIVYEDGRVTVVDADELADALESKIISQDYAIMALRNMNALLEIINKGEFETIKKQMAEYE